MMCHPGKKLLFMGSEYGQFAEWNSNASLEWFMTDFEKHRDMQNYTAALNHFYLSSPELWERDLSWDGFRWIKADDRDHNTAVFMRISGGGEFLVCAFNFSASYLPDYRFGVPDDGKYEEVFASYPSNRPAAQSESIPCDGFDQSIAASLAPLSAVIFRRRVN
jgi:1,4-alpha-glucan branching enzyme